jgi:sugar/nucleoside kinase (ribokinase family)
MAEVVVAGHVCVDLIPALSEDEAGFQYRPGALQEVGPVTISTGGCVPNTGLALHRLGADACLVGKVGEDPLGATARDTLARAGHGLADGIEAAPGKSTSYSVILSPPGGDRMVLHFPGTNDTFENGDVPSAALSSARVFHFGYPPLMRRMYEDGGGNLARILRRAKEAGLTTSLDMAYPDPATAAGKADWCGILKKALPFMDVFLPSLVELLLMVDPEETNERITEGVDLYAETPDSRVSELGERLLGMGTGMAGIKLGERGFYLRTAPEERLAEAGAGVPENLGAWSDQELWSSIFDAEVAGTNGAGDATVAGFLFGLLRRMSPEDAVTIACATGASSVEAADATSGVKRWEELNERIEGGWTRREERPGEDWTRSDRRGLWRSERSSA